MTLKYPRTMHVRGSKGLVEPDHVALEDLPGSVLTIEEKLDGTQVAICFEDGELKLTTRGGPLPRTATFDRLTAWAYDRYQLLGELLEGERYALWGEWLYAKHTMFYDQLDAYFYEYDIYDLHTAEWLSTPRRHELLRTSGIVSVPVLYRGRADVTLDDWLGDSLYQSTNLLEHLRLQCRAHDMDFEAVQRETATLPTEGLFLKSETEDTTVGWYKYIRPGFVEAILASGSHWRDRPLLPNMLRDGSQ